MEIRDLPGRAIAFRMAGSLRVPANVLRRQLSLHICLLLIEMNKHAQTLLKLRQVLFLDLRLPYHRLIHVAFLIVIFSTICEAGMIRIVLSDGVEGSLLLLLLIQGSRLGGKVLEIPQLLAICGRRLEGDRARRVFGRRHLVPSLYHVAGRQVRERCAIDPIVSKLLRAIEIHELLEVQLARYDHGLAFFVNLCLVYYQLVLHRLDLLLLLLLLRVLLPVLQRRRLSRGASRAAAFVIA